MSRILLDYSAHSDTDNMTNDSTELLSLHILVWSVKKGISITETDDILCAVWKRGNSGVLAREADWVPEQQACS